MNSERLQNPVISATGRAEGGGERRRRRRVKVAAQVRVRVTDPKSEPSTDICTTIDVSRDGILFATERRNFWKGMALGVTFPYSAQPGALNAEENAEVVRMVELPEGKVGVAIQFRRAQEKATAARAMAGPGSKEKSTVLGASSTGIGAGGRAPSARPVILAVETDPEMQEQLKAVLGSEGYDVYVVSSGAAALDILRTTVPACFISEVETGDTPGYDLCLIIKNSERLKNVPVILVTRNATPAEYAASHNFGAVVCMAKPFKPERLLQVVRLVAPSPFSPAKNSYSRSSSDSMIERNLS